MGAPDLSTAILDTKLQNQLSVVDTKELKNPDFSIGMRKEDMDRLGLIAGDYVKVIGKKRRICVFFLNEIEVPPDSIGISSENRRNLGVWVGDKVKVYCLKSVNNLKEVIMPMIKEGRSSSGRSEQSEKTSAGSSGADAKEDGQGGENLFSKYLERYLEDTFPLNRGSTYTMSDGSVFKVTELRTVDDRDVLHGIVESKTSVMCTKDLQLEQDKKDDDSVGYDDVGGCRKQLAQIMEVVQLPLKFPQLYEVLGVRVPRGVLLYGPPGTGKTLMAKAIANETGAFLYIINGPEIMSKMSGESENNLRKAFDEAAKHVPAIIFIDEIDSIAPKRDKSQGEVERRIVSQLLTLMDGMKNDRKNLIVIAATNRPNSIDPALRRFGRFDVEIEIGIPDETGRLEMLRIHTKNMALSDDVDLQSIAKETHGFTGSDIASLCTEAGLQQIRERLGEIDMDADEVDVNVLKKLRVTQSNFEHAVKSSNPSSLRETVVEVPNVKWSDVGGLTAVKRELMEMVQFPVEYPEMFLKFGLNPNKGALFYGPPGCGKTLLAKAIATECNANFISVKGPELLTMWVGESEANVREIFDKARAASPCVLFFDELDSIAVSRSAVKSDSGVTDRVLNQLLTEMDGMNVKKNVFVIGATNRPDQLDTAIMRPGRLDQLIYIPLPDLESRKSIFKANLRRAPLAKDVNIQSMAEKLDGFSGADITEICQMAAKIAVRECVNYTKRKERDDPNSPFVDPVPALTQKHFDEAMKSARKSVTRSDLDRYEAFARSMKVDIKGSANERESQSDDDLYDL